jgi:adenylate cyclase
MPVAGAPFRCGRTLTDFPHRTTIALDPFPSKYLRAISFVAAKKAQIVGLTGEFAGKVFPVGDSLLIGRLDSAGLRISNLEVSRRHCQIDRSNDGFRVVDLGSRSGTRLNDVPVQSAEVHSGDILAVGPHTFRFDIQSVESLARSNSHATMAIDDPSAQLMLQEFFVGDYSLAKQIGTVTAKDNLDRLRNHLEIVQAFSQAIQTTLDTTALIERTLDELFRVFGKMDSGVIFLRESAGGPLAPFAIRRRGHMESGPVGYSTTILRSVETEQKAVVILDVSQDARFQDAVSVKLGSMRTHMCVPLVVPGEVVGAIYLVAEGSDEATTGFDAEDLALLASLSGTVAVCVKNASLAREAQRNAQLNSSLQRYVSPEVTRRLIEQGVEGALSARTADGVAMFCDLVGFTTLSEQLSPERMARLLNRYFRRALDIVFKYNGSVNKFGGDSFLAVWGAIESSPSDLISAVRAALEIQNDTFRLSTELASEGVESIELTIGLNRGRFFAGDIGAEDRMEFTVIGDAVNVAARIQALAHASQVLTTLDSLGDARGLMSLLLYRDTPIRGRASGVTVASVRSIASDIHSPAAHEGASIAANNSGSGSWDGMPPRQSKTASGVPVLASIPVQIPGLSARAMIVAALLSGTTELELVSDRAGDVGATYSIAPAAPELNTPAATAEVICEATRMEDQHCVMRMRVIHAEGDFLGLVSPGTERLADRPLRKKS